MCKKALFLSNNSLLQVNSNQIVYHFHALVSSGGSSLSTCESMPAKSIVGTGWTHLSVIQGLLVRTSPTSTSFRRSSTRRPSKKCGAVLSIQLFVRGSRQKNGGPTRTRKPTGQPSRNYWPCSPLF